jgi:site-specific DNA-methyltransferase (adenine-specific)
MKITDKIELTNEDNMALMSRYPDNYFELAIVDPPYGKKPTRDNKGSGGFNNSKNYDNKADIWDVRPTKEYFDELFRVSKNQIIWGANYLIEDLYSSNGWIVWDKKNGDNIFADFELAFYSFSSRARIFKLHTDKFNRFHPTQKPVALYKWLLDKYAKDGDKILDTHLGSGSIAIACHEYGFELTACELDTEYFEKAVERIKNHVAQQKLF